MNRRTSLPLVAALATVAMGTAALGGRPSRASDHADGPSAAGDPSTDITDVFAFMRPEPVDGGFGPSSHLVLAMTVFPNAPATATFDPAGDYLVNVAAAPSDPLAGSVNTARLDVVLRCRFGAPGDGGAQSFVCSCNGQFATGTTGAVDSDSTSPFRVFAGRRADPAFGAVDAVAKAAASGNLPPDAGSNDFAGRSVLAIVAELDVDRVLFGDGGRYPLAISASTGRFP